MLKKIILLIIVYAAISHQAIAAPIQQDEHQESVGKYQGLSDNGDALYLRKVYPDKQHNGNTGFQYYVIGHGLVRMNLGVTQYCKTLKPKWTVDNGDGKKFVVRATSHGSKNMLNSICRFSNNL